MVSAYRTQSASTLPGRRLGNIVIQDLQVLVLDKSTELIVEMFTLDPR